MLPHRWLSLLVPTLLLVGCAPDEPERDPLDPDTIRELSTEQGSATGSAFSGSYSVTVTTHSCDCPSFELDGEMIDVCTLVATLADAQLELVQADGFLVVSTEQAMLTGALEADGSFIVAGEQDQSTLLGPAKLLGRMDGTLETLAATTTLTSTAAQRLIGELSGAQVDCRWTGQVDGTKQ